MTAGMTRRERLRVAGVGAVAARSRDPADAVPGMPPEASKRLRWWSDPRVHAMPRRPWRKVHLDFHNTEHMPVIGAEVNEDAWGDQLVAANVDSIVVFAKDMHGYCYWPSEVGPVHPGLKFDLLGAQVRACRQRGLAVYATTARPGITTSRGRVRSGG